MPTADIDVLDIRKGYVLNEVSALHIKALKNYTDVYGKKRYAGEEWLIDKKMHMKNYNKKRELLCFHKTNTALFVIL